MKTVHTFLFCAMAMACGDDDGATDASPGPDTGFMDVGSMADAERRADAEPVADAGPMSDAGPVADAGPMSDAGPVDGGPIDSGLGVAMSFFISSTALSGTGDLGGLAGADAHCRALAMGADAARTEWFAYLSTEALDGEPAINAVDRIGSGPWYNAAGEVFATDLVSLHPSVDPAVDRPGYIAVKPADALFMDENGDAIAERSHDIFTGSDAEGNAMAGETCRNWTSDARNDTGQVGHTDTPSQERFSPSWNSAHNTAGCSEDRVIERGGVGLIYCFATD